MRAATVVTSAEITILLNIRIACVFRRRYWAMAAENSRKGILRRLDNLRRRHSTHYAQLMVSAVATPPHYVMDDPKSDWWSSEEAQSFYESLNEDSLY
jgi:hypothetical protein